MPMFCFNVLLELCVTYKSGSSTTLKFLIVDFMRWIDYFIWKEVDIRFREP